MIDLLRRLIRFYRVREWVHILGLSVLGFFYITSTTLDIYSFLICIILSSFYLAFGYSSNSVFEDYLEKKKPINLILLSFLPGLICLYAAYLISATLFIVLLIGILLGVLYSVPPIMVKGRPVFDLLVNSALFTILFLVGVLTGGGFITYDVLMISLFVLVMILPFQLVHELEDIQQDGLRGFRTTVLYTNFQNIKTIITLSILATLLMSIIIPLKSQLSPAFTLITSVFCVFILLWIKSLKKDNYAQYKRLRSLFRLSSIGYGVLLLFVFLSSG